MKLFQESDKGKAICNHCSGLVTTTYKRRDVPFSDGQGITKNILVGVCDKCDQVVAIPAQSTPAIKEARQEAPKSLEARLPAIYLDTLDLAAYSIDEMASTDFRKVLLTYFVHRYANDDIYISKLIEASNMAKSAYQENKGGSQRRLSMKMSAKLNNYITELSKKTNLKITDLIKSIVYTINLDVLQSPKPSVLKDLKALAIIS